MNIDIKRNVGAQHYDDFEMKSLEEVANCGGVLEAQVLGRFVYRVFGLYQVSGQVLNQDKKAFGRLCLGLKQHKFEFADIYPKWPVKLTLLRYNPNNYTRILNIT